MNTETPEVLDRIEPTGKRGGDWITFGAEQYRVPPLSFNAIHALQDRIDRMGAVQQGRPTQDQMDAVVEVVHAAMVRNYPEITVPTVAEMVDLGNYPDVLAAVLQLAVPVDVHAAAPSEQPQ